MKILRAILCLAALAAGVPLQAQIDVAKYVVEKMINYDQSTASAPTPDPVYPYQFFSYIVQGTSGSLFTNATLTPPTGGTGIVSYQIGPYATTNPDNLFFAQNFTNKAALDTAFPGGTNPYTLSIQTSTPDNYLDQLSIGPDNYPVVPQLISVTYGPNNTAASWNGGVLVIPDNAQAVTFTWNGSGAGGNTFFSIIGTNYTGNLTTTSFTLPASALSNNTVYHARIVYTNGAGAGASNNGNITGAQAQALFATQLFFNIQFGSLGTLSTTHEVEKDHFLVQTSNSDPVDSPGDFDLGKERAPYSLYVRSPSSAPVTGPNNISLPMTFASTGGLGPQGDYQYLADPVTSAGSLDALYPNGTYTFPDGTQVNLASVYPTGTSSYPSAPKVISVNGATPVWSAQGQLVLDPTISNTITWSSVNVPNLTTTGNETCHFASLTDSSYQPINYYAGLWGNPANSPEFTTLTIPATMKAGETYCCQLIYAASSTAGPATGPNYHVASYGTQTEFYVIAKYPTGLLQAINFPAIANQVYGVAPFTLGATASSALPVSYSVVGIGPAKISGNTLTITGAGTVVIQASQAGNSTYSAAANVQQSFTVAYPNLTFFLGKYHIVLQRSNSASIDSPDPYSSPTTNAGGPYSLYMASTLNGTVVGPGGDYPLSFSSVYYYSSTYASVASMDSINPDGVYQAVDGSTVNLTGDGYPIVPQITQVNGATPVWNSSGQLVLDPTVQNTLTWPAYPASYGSFSSVGYIVAKIYGNQDSLRNTQTAIGPFGQTSFNSLVLPPGTLTSGNTYSGCVGYAEYPTFSFTTDNTYELAEYQTENDFTIVAGSPTGVSQAINLPTIANQSYGAAPIPLGVTTTSGLPVTYNVSGPAAITGNTLTITGAGTVVVTASQTGNGTYAAASTAQQGFTVYPAPLTITANNQVKIVGQIFQFTGIQYTGAGLQNGDAINSLTLTSPGAASSAGIASYPITVSNATGGFNPANYAINYVAGSMDVIAAPTPQPFGTWESNNSVSTGPAGMPDHDGVPNLMKYLYDIVPGSMTAEDRAALPTLGTAMIDGTPYLTLTYRQRASATGILISPQTSSDLMHWSQATSVQTETDPNTGDPVMSVMVPATGTRQFFRLSLALP